MSRIAEQRLSRFLNAGQQDVLRGGKIGLEKETLRVNRDGKIAQTPHPPALGSALTHPYITTDYSEALLEFITPPFPSLRQALQFLCDIHRFVYAKLDQEILWATSMPCVVEGEASIPIAWYGTSNPALMKHVYRRGLGYRYGKIMQVIAGVHFNYSLPERFWPVLRELEQDRRPLPEVINDSYFGLIRNLQRFGWLILYLFGASPAVCKSFLAGLPTTLAEFDSGTYYDPYATSLRMSDIGYKNKHRAGVTVSYDNLDDYVASLTQAIETPYSEYERMGVKVEGEYRQLNANILQIENEYYSTMRPKQVPLGEEKPSLALKRRGVQYVELRSLDVNAFEPMGFSESQLHFLEAFLLFCLFHESPPIDADERRAVDYNQLLAATRGRAPGATLQRRDRSQPLREWAAEICQAMQGICQVLDGDDPIRPYSQALDAQREAVCDPERTPSARMLAEMRERKEAFFFFALRMSERHRAFFAERPLAEEKLRFFEEAARESLQRQHALEAADTISFDEYLRHYFAQA